MKRRLLAAALIARYRKYSDNLERLKKEVHVQRKKIYDLINVIQRHLKEIQEDFAEYFPGWTISVEISPDYKCHVMEFNDTSYHGSRSRKDKVYKGVFIFTEDSLIIRKPTDNIIDKDRIIRSKMDLDLKRVIKFLKWEEEKTGFDIVIHKHKYTGNVTEDEIWRKINFDESIKEIYEGPES